MLTGSIATFFVSGKHEQTTPHIEHIKGLLDRSDDLVNDEQHAAIHLLDAIQWANAARLSMQTNPVDAQ